MATSSAKSTGLHQHLSSQDRRFIDKVVKQACAQLGRCDQAMKESGKQKVCSAAHAGERDYEKLLTAVLERSRNHRSMRCFDRVYMDPNDIDPDRS